MPVEPLALDSDDSLDESRPSSSLRSKPNAKVTKKHQAHARAKSKERSGWSGGLVRESGQGPGLARDRTVKPRTSPTRSLSNGSTASNTRECGGNTPIFVGSSSGDDDDTDTDGDGNRLSKASQSGNALKRLRRQSSTPTSRDDRPVKAGRLEPALMSEDEVEEIIHGGQSVPATDKGKGKAPSPGWSASPRTDAVASIADRTADGTAVATEGAAPPYEAETEASDTRAAKGMSGPNDAIDADDEGFDDASSSIGSTVYSTDSEPPESGKEFYTSSEGSLHGSDSEEGLGSWTVLDQRKWQGDTSHLDEAYDGHYYLRAVLRHRKHPRLGFVQYRTMWAGYPIYSTTWEPESNFDQPETVKEYWERQGGRPADCPPPPENFEWQASSEDTDVAQYRRPRAKAHKALKKRRREIRKDKHDWRKLAKCMNEEKRRKDERELARLEKARKKRKVEMEPVRVRDDNDEARLRSLARRERQELIRQKRWRRRQRESNASGPTSTFPKKISGSSQVLLPNVSMKGGGRSAPAPMAKRRAAEVDDLPTDDVDLPAFRPAPNPAPTIRPSSTAAPAPPPKPPPVPGSYKGVHKAPPKIKVIDPPSMSRVLNVSKKEPPKDHHGLNTFLNTLHQDAGSAPSAAATAASTSARTLSVVSPPVSAYSQSHVHPDRIGLVPGVNEQQQPATSSFPSQPFGLPQQHQQQHQQQRRPFPVPAARPAIASNPTADPRRRPNALRPQAPPHTQSLGQATSPVPSLHSPRSVSFDEPMPMPAAGGLGPPPKMVTYWHGRAGFTLGASLYGFEAQMCPHSDSSPRAAADLGFDPQVDHLRFDFVFPMPLFREMVHHLPGLASRAFLLEATGLAREEGVMELERVNQLLLEADLLVASRIRGTSSRSVPAYLVVFSSTYPADPDVGLPHGFPPVISPQLWAVPVELRPDAAPSARFFRIPAMIDPYIAGCLKQAEHWRSAMCKENGLKRSDVRKAARLAGRYRLDSELAQLIKTSYNLIFCSFNLPLEHTAIIAFVRVLQGGLREGLKEPRDEKLWRGKGLNINVFVHNLVRGCMFRGSDKVSSRFPLGEHLRQLKRLRNCRFYAYGFDPSLRNEEFTPLFPIKSGGLVTISLSALLAELLRSALDEARPIEEGQLEAPQRTEAPLANAEAMARSLPEGWRFLLHPWLLSTVKLLEPHLQEVVEGLDLLPPGSSLPPTFELEERLDAFTLANGYKTVDLKDICSPPFEEPSEASLAEPLEVVRALDAEVYNTMMKIQYESMTVARFHVVVMHKSEEDKSEAQLAGLERMSVRDVVKGRCIALSHFPGNF
ncbi:hypothetical protein ACQY0O_004002 [Thecaphora frezii]